MRLLVIFAVTGAGERFKTHVTLKRPVTGMRTIVNGQATNAGKQFVAHITF